MCCVYNWGRITREYITPFINVEMFAGEQTQIKKVICKKRTWDPLEFTTNVHNGVLQKPEYSVYCFLGVVLNKYTRFVTYVTTWKFKIITECVRVNHFILCGSRAPTLQGHSCEQIRKFTFSILSYAIVVCRGCFRIPDNTGMRERWYSIP